MAKVRLQAGAEFDLLNKDELSSALSSQSDADQVARLHGIRHMRLPEVLVGTPSSSKISLDGNTGPYPLGPRSGYAWSITRLIVSGLTAGSTPDVVNLYKGAPGAGVPLWQFNGINFGYTFGKLDMVLYGGETLSLQNSGSIAATGQIGLGGELIECPAELIGKLA
jgi:hypothetical protein